MFAVDSLCDLALGAEKNNTPTSGSLVNERHLATVCFWRSVHLCPLSPVASTHTLTDVSQGFFVGSGGAIFNAGEIVVESTSSFTDNTAAVRPAANELCLNSVFLEV